jgi:hypothetical protein
MVATRKSLPAKLFVGMIFAEDFPLVQAEEQLIAEFGSPEIQSPLLPFTLTRYYASEMGHRLWRKFVIFQSLIAKDQLLSIKKTTFRMEHLFSVNRNGLLCRRINLDPGYLTLSQLVLATRKERAHRIYLGDAIYGDLHLRYQRGASGPCNGPILIIGRQCLSLFSLRQGPDSCFN